MKTPLKHRIRELLDRRIREWVVRLVAICLGVLALLAHFEILHVHLAPDEFLAPLFFLIWIIFELQLAEGKEVPSNGPPIVEWLDAVPAIRKQIVDATDVLILGSSSESMYVLFKEAIEGSRDLSVRLLLRKCDPNDRARVAKQISYQAAWMSLNDSSRRVKVEVKFCDNDILRGVVIDNTVAHVGFYEWRDHKLWGHSVPVMAINKDSGGLHSHLLKVFLNRAERYWEVGVDTAS